MISSSRGVRRLFIFLHDCTGFIAAARVIFSDASTSEYSSRNYSNGFALHRLRSRKPNFIGGPLVSAPPEELGLASADWKPIDLEYRRKSCLKRHPFISYVVHAYLAHVSRHFNRLIPDASNFAIGIKDNFLLNVCMSNPQ